MSNKQNITSADYDIEKQENISRTNQNNKTNPVVILQANGKIKQKNDELFW